MKFYKNKILAIIFIFLFAFLFACENKNVEEKNNEEIENHEVHECKHLCPECGKCADSNCTDPVCQDKCTCHAVENELANFATEFATKFPMEVTEDLVFENEVDGVYIFYTSHNLQVIDNYGNVTFPNKDTIVTITITFCRKNPSGNDIVKTCDLDVLVRAKVEEQPPITDDNGLTEFIDEFLRDFPTEANKDLEFITFANDVTIFYSSNNESIIDNNGKVTLPETDTLVTVTVSFFGRNKEGEDVIESRELPILVHAKENVTPVITDDYEQIISEIEQIIYLGIAFNNPIKENIALPTTSLYDSLVRWESSNESIISTTGIVAQDIDNKSVTLTYYITYLEKEYGPYTIVVTVDNDVNSGNDNPYYSSISSSLKGSNLKSALRTLITTTHKYKTSYEDLKSKTALTDADPNKKGNIILFYSRKSVSAKWDGGNTWNREHVWPQSKSWFTTSGAGSDIHHLRPANPSINSSRGNKAYGLSTNSSFYCPDDCVKGDVARIVFYLLVRYPESDSYSISKVAYSMDMLLEWNELDPVDELEINRNNEAYKIQGNRNPFIDYSEYANLIWGSQRVNSTDIIGEFIELNVVLISDLKKDYMEI